ncbi:hypothetical protein FHS35_009101 [Streptomyces umbrinus]|uniref:hypothetical protein n=2 Tax=Streptomyces umbrinus TaxID=67370 RepID=UPI00214D2787|nr:hypothetical protein [Streptomyces umbrinus]MCR3732183.1 hypothetical protein [Streptomyces umbrinus]
MATLASMTVQLGIDTDQLRAGAEKAKGVLKGLGKMVAGLGIGVPVAAAVAAGVGGLAAAFVSAGIAAKAFQLAVGPQMQAVAEVATLAEEAEKAAAAGAEDAAEKQKAYNDALAQLPPATRATAKEFIGLKKDYSAWSDSLSSTTMPVFTKGLQIMRRLLPALTPFAKAGAQAFGEFIDEIDRATQGKGLQAFAESMAKVAGQNLKSFLFGLKNIAVGIGGVIKAFLPLSDEMSGGFESGTAAFAKWGQSLSGSQGFAQFLALAKQGATTIGALVSAALKLAVALSPLIGITAAIALQLANFINSLPPGVVQGLAFAILGAVVALKAFKAASAAVDSASALMNSRLGQMAGRWVRTAATAVAAQARIAASAALNAARTAAVWALSAARMAATWLVQIIRTALVTAAQFAMMAARAIAWAVVMAAQWLVAFWPIALIIAAVAGLVALVIIYWDEIKAATVAAWNYAVGVVRGAVTGIIAGVMLLARIPGLVLGFFTRMKDAAVRQATSLVSWMRGLPGRLGSALGNMGTLLVSKGKDVVRGLWNGIKSMGSWLKSQLIGFAKTMIPGPFIKALGIGSPSKVMGKEVGRWVPPGVVEGAEGAAPAMDKALRGLVDVPGLTTARRGSGTSAASATRVLIEVAGPEAVKRLIRTIVANDGGGDVQKAFGQ